MDFKFDVFGKYLLYTLYFWYITMPIAALLLWACLHKSNSNGIRWIAGIGAAVLLFPVVVLLWELVSGSINDGIEKREFKQRKALHTYSLKQPETIAGIALSAEDTVYYAMDFDMNSREQAQLKDIDSVHLSKPVRFFNLEVKGVIGAVLYDKWNITLTHQQPVFGWPCTGNVVIGADSTFVKGTLAEDYMALGYSLPKGSEVSYKEDNLITIILPDLRWLTIDAKTKQPIAEEDKKLADSLQYKRP